MNQYLGDKEEDFAKVIDFFKKEIQSLRVGRANPEILDNVLVEAYGAKTRISGVASISVTDARSMLVQPWDRSVTKEIEKGIVEADLGLSVVNEGDKIRLMLPIMTEENRKGLVKKLNELLEEARISLRKVRDEAKQSIEAAEKDKSISEDDKFRFLRELEELVASRNDELKALRDKKDQEIMTI
jgi:ribosome recycling factor